MRAAEMLAFLLVIALLIPAAPAAAAIPPASDKERIRTAFETAFDYARPVAERAAVIEHGRALRSALVWRDSDMALAGHDVRASVDTVRVYGDRAEVHFEFTDAHRSLGGLVPFGVAVRSQGNWKVSEYTVCEIAAIVGDGCRGQDPGEAWRRRWQGSPIPLNRELDGDHVIVPLTFADGTSVGLRLSRDLTTKEFYVRSQASLRVAGSITSVSVVYLASRPPMLTEYASPSDRAVVLDYGGSLDFRIGRWTVMVDAAALSPSERALVARELRPRVAASGLVELDTGGQIELHAPAPSSGGSRSVARSASWKRPRVSDDLAPFVQIRPAAERGRFGALYVAHTGCSQVAVESRPQHPSAPSRCWDDVGVEVSAEGGTVEDLARLVRESSITIVC